MKVIDAIKSRKSIRAYLPKTVPQEIVKEILAAAIQAPSAVNNQPWEITLVTGEILDKIKHSNVDKLLAGVPVNESKTAYSGVNKLRRVELAVDIFALMDIQREDHDKRMEWLKRGFRFFDAPIAIIIAADKSLRGTWAPFDIGCIAQTICLAAMNYGLGTCIEDQGVLFPEVIKQHIGMSEDKDVIIGIALGYPDPAFPANQLVSRRASVDEVTTWLGF